MSAYEEDADRLAEHVADECDDQFCQICIEEEADEADDDGQKRVEDETDEARDGRGHQDCPKIRRVLP